MIKKVPVKSLSEKGSDPLRRGKKAPEIDSPPKGQTPFRIGSLNPPTEPRTRSGRTARRCRRSPATCRATHRLRSPKARRKAAVWPAPPPRDPLPLIRRGRHRRPTTHRARKRRSLLDPNPQRKLAVIHRL